MLGCGPYGMAAAAHLRAVGVDARVCGEPMKFWQEQMPAGMFLRSAWYACDIADPCHSFTLEIFLANQGILPAAPVPWHTFIEYGQWFQRSLVPDVDRRHIESIASNGEGFCVRLEDGETLNARRVVVAAGISRFANRPPQFNHLPTALVTHSSDHNDLARFNGRRVAVIGGGQSAFETAALLHESGSDVEIIMRTPRVRWLRGNIEFRRRLSVWRRLFYPRTDVGPPGLNQIVARPMLLRCFPPKLRALIARRSTRPSAASWLEHRLKSVKITTSRQVGSASRCGDRIKLELDDASSREVDHVILGTGYRVDIARYPFLTPDLLRSIACVDGHPRLDCGFQTTVKGLHFLGAPAAWSFGPLAKFVSGTEYSGRALARSIVDQGRRK